MARSGPLVLAMALLVAACGGDRAGDVSTDTVASTTAPTVQPGTDAPSTTTEPVSTTSERREGPATWLVGVDEPVPRGLPPLLISDGTSVHVLRNGETTTFEIGQEQAGTAVGDGEGTIVAERLGPAQTGEGLGRELLVREESGWRELPTPDASVISLHDVVVLGGVPHVLYSTSEEPGDGEQHGWLYLQSLADGQRVQLDVAAAPEFGVGSASASATGIAVSATSDLTETIYFLDYAGDRLDEPSPTDDLDYNSPPYMTGAVLSPDGSELAYLEGPDSETDVQTGDTEIVGDWDVVVLDDSGEQLRLAVADRAVDHVELDFDGRWLVLSGYDDGVGYIEPLVIDTESVDTPAAVLTFTAGQAMVDAAASSARP